MAGNCIIILNYNDGTRTEGLVNEIRQYDSLDKILIVDNCSTDLSYEKLAALQNEKITVIQTGSNGGYATGNNFGAWYAIEKWGVKTIFFANPDVHFNEQAIVLTERNLWEKEAHGIAAPLVKNGYNAWTLPAYWGTVRMLFLGAFNIHKYMVKQQLLLEKGVHEVGVTEGSFFAVKASVFQETGGFDERTFLYLEENILAFKLAEKKYKEVIVSDVFYDHEHSQSIKKEYQSKRKAFALFKPSFEVYLKYYVNCGPVGLKLFSCFYWLAYVERVIYDVLKRGK